MKTVNISQKDDKETTIKLCVHLKSPTDAPARMVSKHNDVWTDGWFSKGKKDDGFLIDWVKHNSRKRKLHGHSVRYLVTIRIDSDVIPGDFLFEIWGPHYTYHVTVMIKAKKGKNV